MPVLEQRLRAPEPDLDKLFGRSQVVMMNEAHDDLRRCVRTREIGRRILPVAHECGARCLAMEALHLPEQVRETNITRHSPVPIRQDSYLAQPEMRSLIQTALDLEFDLAHYEANMDEFHAGEEDPMSVGAMNQRDEMQARNLIRVLDALPQDAELLVWCGNSHLLKIPGVSRKRRFYAPDGSVVERETTVDVAWKDADAYLISIFNDLE